MGTIPDFVQADGGRREEKVWLQNLRRRSWKRGSFHIRLGILSRPGALLPLKDLIVSSSSCMAKVDVLMSSSLAIWIRGKALFPRVLGGCPPSSFRK